MAAFPPGRFPRNDTSVRYSMADFENEMRRAPTPPRAPGQPQLGTRPAHMSGVATTGPAMSSQTAPAFQSPAPAFVQSPAPVQPRPGAPVVHSFETGPGGEPVFPSVVQTGMVTAPTQHLPTHFIETAVPTQVAPGTSQTVVEVLHGQPMDPIMAEPGLSVAPMFLPAQQYVNRMIPYPVPFPVYNQVPTPMPEPPKVNNVHKTVAPHYDHDFPYHDAAYGCGWRFHYPDNLDEALLHMPTYRPTPMEEMRHAAYEEQMKQEWVNAHVAESQYGVRHRHLPYSRRVRNPERLIPDPEDYSEIIL